MDNLNGIDHQPVILDKEDPDDPPLQLVYHEAGDDKFGYPIKQEFVQTVVSKCAAQSAKQTKKSPANSWHVISSQLNKQQRCEQRYPAKQTHRNSHGGSCNCRAEDFYPIAQDHLSPCPTMLTVNTEYNPRQFINLQGKMTIRQTLEGLLATAMSIQINANDTYRSMSEHYNGLNECLAYVTQYLECLGLEARSLSQLCSHVARIKLGFQEESDENSCTFKLTLNQLSANNPSEYYWMKDEVASEQANNADVEGLMYDFNNKRKDYQRATKNLKSILDTNFTTAQLHKLKEQFEIIQNKFLHSQNKLKMKFPIAISKKHSLLVNTFAMLGEDMQTIANDRQNFSMICQHLENTMRDKYEGDCTTEVYEEDITPTNDDNQ